METPTTTRPGYSDEYTGARAPAAIRRDYPDWQYRDFARHGRHVDYCEFDPACYFCGGAQDPSAASSDAETARLRGAISVRAAYAFGDWPPAEADR